MRSCGPTPSNPARGGDYEQGGSIPCDKTIEEATSIAAQARAHSGGRHETPFSTQNKFGSGHQAPKSASVKLTNTGANAGGAGHGMLSNFKEQVTSLRRRSFSDEAVDWRTAFMFLNVFIIVHWLLNFRKPAPNLEKPHVDLPSIDDDELLAKRHAEGVPSKP